MATHIGKILSLVPVMAAVLVLAAQPRPASAASTLTPSENPVIIAAPGQTKTITLAWTLDGRRERDRGQLVVTENGGPVVLNQSLLGAAGSTPLTVTCGVSYDAKLRNADGTTVAQVTIVAQRPGQPPTPCPPPTTTFALKDVKITPHGTYVDVTVISPMPASFVAEIGINPPLANGTFAPGDLVSVGFRICCTTDWVNGKVYTLEPDTTYHWVIRASAQTGEKAIATGTVQTLKRRVEVTFTKIWMLDDSDNDFPGNDCDCIFFFQAGGEPYKTWGDPSNGVATGEYVYPNLVIGVNNAPDALTVRVEGYDDDGESCVFIFCFVDACGLAPNWGSGHGPSGACASDYATAQSTLSTIPQAAGLEAYTENFWMQTTNGPVKFQVWGSYKVSYF